MVCYSTAPRAPKERRVLVERSAASACDAKNVMHCYHKLWEMELVVCSLVFYVVIYFSRIYPPDLFSDRSPKYTLLRRGERLTPTRLRKAQPCLGALHGVLLR